MKKIVILSVIFAGMTLTAALVQAKAQNYALARTIVHCVDEKDVTAHPEYWHETFEKDFFAGSSDAGKLRKEDFGSGSLVTDAAAVAKESSGSLQPAVPPKAHDVVHFVSQYKTYPLSGKTYAPQICRVYYLLTPR